MQPNAKSKSNPSKTWAPLLLLCLSACAPAHVQVKDMALGKVVVYRNGVAFYERQAQLEGNELKIQVPQDKIDDFLKSLTITDEETGKALPISFPSQGQATNGIVELTLDLPPGHSSNLKLTYISAAPAWKPSYRIRILDDDKVEVQGWAIVDNTSGEDWKDVLIGVGSSSALSFRYDLWSIRDVHREQLSSDDRFAVAPPTGTTTFQEKEGKKVLAALDGNALPVTAPGDDFDSAFAIGDVGAEAPSRVVAGAKRAGNRPHASERARPAPRKKADDLKRSRDQLDMLASSARRSAGTVVLETYGGKDKSRVQQSVDQANYLRNELISRGIAPAKLQVRTLADETLNSGENIRMVSEETTPNKAQAQVNVDDTPVGESHFESEVPMSVEQGRSVMVSLLKQETAGTIVYLYDPSSERGNKRYAFKSVRMTNPTEATLDSGPVTVFGSSRFIGEGLIDPISPQSTAMIPFALDRQVVVESTTTTNDAIDQLISLNRGVLRTEVAHTKTRKYKISNRRHKPSKVYIKHASGEGWTMEKRIKNIEQFGKAYLIPVTLKAGETKTIVVKESTPLHKTLDIRAPGVLSMVRLYLRGDTDELAPKVEELLALQKEISDAGEEITSLRKRMNDYRVRMDELHMQIVTLKAVKSGGELMKHLKRKLQQISNKVQQATMKVVDREEELMLAKIQFQDAVAELSIEKTIAKK